MRGGETHQYLSASVSVVAQSLQKILQLSENRVVVTAETGEVEPVATGVDPFINRRKFCHEELCL